MSLSPIPIPVDIPDIPTDIDLLIREADDRIDQFYESRIKNPIKRFVPSDFVEVFTALHFIARQRLSTGSLFCEWGSGFGVATCLASLLGFEAYGIEIEHDLIVQANQLAHDFDIAVTYLHGSFIPEGFDVFHDHIGDSTQLIKDTDHLATNATHGDSIYREIGLEVQDFDLIFAYPWPGEAQMVEELFDETASDGALLLTYYGLEDIHLRRKE